MRFVFAALIGLALPLPQLAAQSALLVGLHLMDSDGVSTYRTFLITFRDGKAQLAADMPDIIVPRKTGFWRVGSIYKDSQEFVYAAPVRSVPHALGEYHPPDPGSFSDKDESTIEFVNPDLISVSYFHEDAGSLEVELRHETYKLDNFGRPLDIADVLGPVAWEAEMKADSAAKSEAPMLQDCLPYLISKPDRENWAIEGWTRIPHSSARPWILVGNYNSAHNCSDGASYEIKFPVPQPIADAQYHADDLSALLRSDVAEKNRIGTDDSLITPNGDFLITVDTPIRVFRVVNHSIQIPAIASVPSDHSLTGDLNVVMFQWALGKHVADWERELKSIAATKLPEPLVDIGRVQK